MAVQDSNQAYMDRYVTYASHPKKIWQYRILSNDANEKLKIGGITATKLESNSKTKKSSGHEIQVNFIKGL